jgi:hypothetical protein
VEEANVRVSSVETRQSKSGNTRWVVRADDGREYTTFRSEIGRQAEQYQGRAVRIRYHEEDRDGFHNVYLDGIDASPDGNVGPQTDDGPDPEAAAWHTAVEAAPWLVGPPGEEGSEDAKDLYERLRPFKDLIAKDIRESRDHDG